MDDETTAVLQEELVEIGAAAVMRYFNLSGHRLEPRTRVPWSDRHRVTLIIPEPDEDEMNPSELKSKYKEFSHEFHGTKPGMRKLAKLAERQNVLNRDQMSSQAAEADHIPPKAKRTMEQRRTKDLFGFM
jgi:hypothetical protein